MQGNKEKQEISVIGRLLSLEALVFLMGIASLLYGLIAGVATNVAIGAVILVVTFFWARQFRRRNN
jgi:hypothetical protein